MSIKGNENMAVIGDKLKQEVELESLKKSHIRVERVEKIRLFYQELVDNFHWFDVFDAYKEDFEKKYAKYEQEFKDYVLPLAGNEEHDFKTVIARAEEKTIVLKECMRMIILCLTATITVKRKLDRSKGGDKTSKITKGRLIESIKEIERYMISITLYPRGLQSSYFDEIQQLRISFLLDAMNQLLEHADIQPKHVPLLFNPSTTQWLEQIWTDPRRLSVTKHIKKRIKTQRQFKQDNTFKRNFMWRFLLKIEDAMLRSVKVEPQ